MLIDVSYMVLALGAFAAGDERAALVCLLGYFVAMTFGGLYILPDGRGLFMRIVPAGWSATAVAIWFSVTLLGSFAIGLLGTIWRAVSPDAFFPPRRRNIFSPSRNFGARQRADSGCRGGGKCRGRHP